MAENEWPSEYKKVPTEEVSDEKPNVPESYGYGIRHIQCFLFFLCVTVSYIARAHLGVSVVAMTRQTDEHNITILNTAILSNEYNRTVANVIETGEINIENEAINVSRFGTQKNEYNETFERLVSGNGTADNVWNVYRSYEWTKATQEMVLGAFFLGYSLAMFPMGMAIQRFGGKIPLQIGLLVNAVVSIVTPSVAVWGGWKAVCACRVLQGICQSGLYPCMHTLLAKWVPIQERATLVGYVYTGSTLGTVIGFQLGGLLASSSVGWPSTFWLVGAICLVAFVFITVFTATTPADHRTITAAEKNYIMGAGVGSKMKPKLPWKQIFSSKPVWGTFISHISCGICYVFLFTQIPTYMHSILGFNIKSSGLLSSLPYIGSFFFAIAYGVLSDFCINRGIVTLKTTRIVCNSLGQVAPAACLIAVSYIDNIPLAVILIVAAVSLFAGVHTGWMVNYIDMSPNFSGSLMAVGNTACGAGVLLLPVLVSNIVTEVIDRSQWRIIMFVMAGSMFLGNLFYVCFMSTDKQPWDENIDHDEIEKEAEQTKK